MSTAARTSRPRRAPPRPSSRRRPSSASPGWRPREAGLIIAPTKRAMVQSRLFSACAPLGLGRRSRPTRPRRARAERDERRQMISCADHQRLALLPRTAPFRHAPRRDPARPRSSAPRRAGACGSGRPAARAGRSPTRSRWRSCASIPGRPTRHPHPRDRHRPRRSSTSPRARHLPRTSRCRASRPADRTDLLRRGGADASPSSRTLRALVSFRELNLLAKWPMKGPLRRHLLPQRGDLLRRRDPAPTLAALRSRTDARRVDLPRPFRAHSRNARARHFATPA